jgi:lipopolysaccharide transport system permease protein
MDVDISAAKAREIVDARVDSGHALERVQIRATSGWRAVDWAEFWRYRELLWFLAVRDIKLRYKQTALGVAWAVIQPLFTMAVSTILFGKLARLPSDGVPYPLLILVALLPWQLFAYSLTQSSNSLVAEQRLITKVYFPRLIVPVASILAGVVDLVVTFCLTLAMLAFFAAKGWFQPTIGPPILMLPLFVVFALATALAVGLWLSALNVQFRDIRYVIPFVTQLWMLASPVGYSSSIIPAKYRLLYDLNPMAGVVDGFRWVLLGTTAPGWAPLGVSVVVVVLLLVGGLYNFRRLERSFADLV